MVLSQVLTSSNTVYIYIYIYIYLHHFLTSSYTIRCTLYVDITVLHHTSYQ